LHELAISSDVTHDSRAGEDVDCYAVLFVIIVRQKVTQLQRDFDNAKKARPYFAVVDGLVIVEQVAVHE